MHEWWLNGQVYKLTLSEYNKIMPRLSKVFGCRGCRHARRQLIEAWHGRKPPTLARRTVAKEATPEETAAAIPNLSPGRGPAPTCAI